MTVESKISAAIEELTDAQDEAEMGTSLMLQSRIADLQDLRTRVSNINDDNSNDA